jgi:hypothetical protein
MDQIKTNYSNTPTSKVTPKYKAAILDTDTAKPSIKQDTVSFSKESENALLKQMVLEKEKQQLYEKENHLNTKEKYLTEKFSNQEKALIEQTNEKEKALNEKMTQNERYLDEKKTALRQEREKLDKEKKEFSERGGLSQIFSGVKKIFLPNS